MSGYGFGTFWRRYLQCWPYRFGSLHARLFAMLGVGVRVPGVLLEARRHGAAIAAQEVDDGPVFLVGHWRSGTTHLHNVLSQDPQFGTISFSRSAMPLDCLGKVRPARALMNLLMPKTRGMDAVAIDADSPQEEEMALAALGSPSFFDCFYFPRSLDESFRRSVLMEGLAEGERQRLADHYRYLAQKMGYLHSGAPTLFKNPANTARLRFLKSVFPHAKFVHIVRDPYEVFPSMMKLWQRLLDAFALQGAGGRDFVETTLSIYERTMRRHLDERAAIGDRDYCEVRYEELAADPERCVARIYRELELPGHAAAEGAVRTYLDSLGEYQRRPPRPLGDALRERIADRWGFAFEAWGYPR